MKRRVAAIDWGKARIGVAVSDELGMLAHPRPFVDAKNRRAALETLVQLARDEKLERFVVGLPLDYRGDEGPSARQATDFARALADATGLPVELLDERWTTVEATRALENAGVRRQKKTARIDGAAAAVLLQGWLDARR